MTSTVVVTGIAHASDKPNDTAQNSAQHSEHFLEPTPRDASMFPVIAHVCARGGTAGAYNVTGFTLERRTKVSSNDKDAASQPKVPNEGPKPATPPERFIAFLFDDMHLSNEDLYQTKKAATRMLDNALSESDVAVVIATSGGEGGLTRDRSKLQKAIQSLTTHELFQHSAGECPKLDYYQADRIVNWDDELNLMCR